MRRLLAVTFAGYASLAIAAPPAKPKIVSLAPREAVPPADPESVRSQLRTELVATYQGLAAAAELGDAKAILSIRLPEYTETAPDLKVLDAAGAARALADWLDTLRRPVKIVYDVGKVDAQQDAATVVVGRRVIQREVVDGKSVEVEVVTQRLETWLRRPEGWRLRHAGAESVVQRLVDGVVVPVR